MSDINKNIYPKKFVGLHSHALSVGDSIGFPQEHIDFAHKNGMDGIALTDHGHMNGGSHYILHLDKLKQKGINMKMLLGVEAYFIPSLSDWRRQYNEFQEQKKIEKLEKERAAATKKNKKLLLDALADTKEELQEVRADNEADEALTGNAGIEDEQESKSNKWKNPIFRRNHLVLLPKNSEGLKSLFKCVSYSYINGFYKYPRMDFELLEREAKGNIIGITACVASTVSQIIFDNQIEKDWEKYKPNDDNKELIQKQLKELIDRFHQALGEGNFYLETQMNRLGAQHLTNYHLIEASKRTGVPLVVTADSHYANPDHWREREIYKAMARLQMFKSKPEEVGHIPEKIDELKCELYPKNADQLWKTYQELKNEYSFYDDKMVCEAIERTYTIAHEQIEDVTIDRKVKLPAIKKLIKEDRIKEILDGIKDKDNKQNEEVIAFQELKSLVIKGAKWRKVHEKEEYINRLKHELEVIKHLNLSKYFLTYHKIMDLLTKEMLTGTGRGSACGSLVTYVLNITQIDPIKNNLLFQRFLVRSKKGYADVDSDCGDRDEALKIITKYFGEENVIAISNFNQLQLRSLIKDATRLQGLPFEEVNNYTKNIEREALLVAKQTPGFDAQQWVLTYEEAEKNSQSFRDLMAKYPDLERTVKILFKQIKSIGRHAGGVAVGNNLTDNMPVIKSGGVLQTPWSEGLNYRHLEPFGFLKFDILGLGTLRIFENTIKKNIKKEGNKYPTFKDINKFYYDNVHPDNNPMDDMKVYKNVFWDKKFIGTFQFVKNNVQDFVSKLKPTSIADLAATTSVFRPGPLSLSADKLFLKNKSHPEDIEYKHPLLKEILAETCGLIIFQEQTQLIYHKLAGVPLDETDSIRKALTKKDISNKEKTLKDLEKLKQDFVALCKKNNNIDEDVSESIFEDIEKYTSYSFNKCLLNTEKVDVYSFKGPEFTQKEIKDIKPGDFVKSRNEETKEDIFVEVVKNHNNGLKKVYEIEFEDGRKVCCTLDHKFRIKDGRMLPIGQIFEEKLELA